MSRSEVEGRADFSRIRYAQVWEDADILLEGLDIQPGDTCLAIASAGDDALAMLAKSPEKVVALDLNPAQLYCLELRVAAYRTLTHPELLRLIGSDGDAPGIERSELYRRCRTLLSDNAQRFWNAHPGEISHGIGSAGKFERYFALFRSGIIPLIHDKYKVWRLLEGSGTVEERTHFYETKWNTARWKWLFRLFFSRTAMGKLGRDPAFFQYVEGTVSDRILARTRHALTELDPAKNPYLQWILTGRHLTAMPYALRPENFDAIRNNLERLEWHCLPIETYLEQSGTQCIDRFNLSDIFEYMSLDAYAALLERLVQSSNPRARLAYWNMLAPRRRPESLSHLLRPLDEEAQRLHLQDKAFFYSAFVLEEVL